MPTSGQTILASHYNTIRTRIYNVLGPVSTGYGYTGDTPSVPVIVGNTPTADEWLKLYNEVNRCIVHQTNSALSLPVGITTPAVGGIIYASFVNTLESYSITAETNKATVAAGQLLSSTANGSSTRTSVWGSDITHEVTYDWASSLNAQYFFNLGGRLQVSMSYANSTGSADDLAWISLINSANSVFGNLGNYFGLPNYTSGSTIVYVAASSGANSIVVTFSRTSLSQVKAKVELLTSGTTINLDVTCTVTYYYSRGDLGGVAAPQPAGQVTIDLQTGGAVAPVVQPTRIAYVPTTPTAYNFYSGQTSAEQTIVISNIGNSLLSISNITYTTNGNVTPVPVYSWGATPVTTISGGSFKTFTLAYSGSTLGSYNNSFTVISDNDAGPYAKATSQVISSPPFNFTLSPASWTLTATDRSIRNQFFNINAVNGSFSTYSASVSGSFTLDITDPAGPRVVFNPTLLANGTYSGTLIVTVNSITHTANISITLAAPTTQNLGSWISAQAEYNSVVGMSYDYISGIKYLTIGVGMAADGVGDLSADGSGYASVSNLGTTADNKYSEGIVIYKAPGDTPYSAFLTNYGVWFRPSSYADNTLINIELERSYTISVPTSANYDWEFSIDNSGYFDIDGSICGDLRYTSNPYTLSITGTVYLTAGNHTLTFRALNTNGPASVAIRLRNSTTLQELWSTLNPVRSVTPYQYWNEVYRIPLTQGAATYYSYDYCIKAYGIEDGTRYGDHYGTAGTENTRSLFTVVDDGSGNLTVSMNTFSVATGSSYEDRTMANLPYSVYYYTNLSAIVRYTQLSGPEGDGTQTQQFLGFNSDGTVRTSLVTYPGYGAGGGGSGGCPAPWHKILMADDQIMAAGDITPGMFVRTFHSETMEWNDFEIVSAETIQDQERLEIVFDHVNFVCSPTHVFFKGNDKWVRACDLQAEEVLHGHKITAIREYERGPVVKLTVKDAHSYICENLLSHNIKYNPIGGGVYYFYYNSILDEWIWEYDRDLINDNIR